MEPNIVTNQIELQIFWEVTEAIAILLIIIVENIVAFAFLLKHCEPKCSQVSFLQIFLKK